MSRTKYGIFIDTFRGRNAGATHWYGEVWGRDRDYPTTKLSHVLDQREADMLNEADRSLGSRGMHHPGESTERFRTRQKVIDAGIALLTERHGDQIEVELGSFTAAQNPLIYPELDYRLNRKQRDILMEIADFPMMISQRDFTYARYPEEIDYLLECRLLRITDRSSRSTTLVLSGPGHREYAKLIEKEIAES